METLEYTSCTPKRVILGDLNNQHNNNNNNGSSPISPMANLKLLIKVATSGQQHKEAENSQQPIVLATPPRNKSKPKYTRQLRSLGFICKKFLQFYSLDVPLGESKQLSLGNLAQILEIEKRRVYDIINVVSSLNMAVKVCKDRYIWYGNQYLTSVLLKLKAHALENKVEQLVESIFRHPLQIPTESCMQNCLNERTTLGCETNIACSGNSSEHSIVEDNRIRILCQKFMMLFLVTPQNGALNLSLVSRLILARDIQDKTGMRRLYDIANVLESLGLIERRNLATTRKPSFVYCGPDLSAIPLDQYTPGPPGINNMHQQDLLDVVPLDSIDANSESDKDSQQECRLSDMLQVVCTELEKLNEARIGNTATGGRSPSAKKQLFPRSDVVDQRPSGPQPRGANASSFIKAPDHSFRLLCNKITNQPQHPEPIAPDQEPDKVSSSTHPNVDPTPRQVTSKFGQLSRYFPRVAVSTTASPSMKKDSSSSGLPTIRLNRIAKPIRIIRQLKLTSSDIQNGGIYKAVKNGNVIHLVKM